MRIATSTDRPARAVLQVSPNSFRDLMAAVHRGTDRELLSEWFGASRILQLEQECELTQSVILVEVDEAQESQALTE